MAVAERSCLTLFLVFIFLQFIICERHGLPSRTLHVYQDKSDSQHKRQIQVVDAGTHHLPGDDILGDWEELESAGHLPSGLRRKRRDVNKTNISTQSTTLNDSHQQLMVHWAGEGSKVILCLARDPAPASDRTAPSDPSAVYLSYDYGETFVNKTSLFQLGGPESNYASLEKFYSHPKFNTHTVFVDVANKVIFTTQDNVVTVQKVKLDFHPTDITFREEEPLVFLAYDKISPDRKLWMTSDFGQTWTTVQEFVKSFFWSAPSERGAPVIQPTLLYVEREEPGGTSSVLSSDNLFLNKRHTLVISGIEDFQVKGDFMFATKKAGKTDLDLYVSYQRGPFMKAVFQSELDRQDYHVASIEGNQVLIVASHTDELANLYVSEIMDKTTIKFALSLERIFCFFPNATWKDTWLNGLSEEPFADLHKVEGMKGIYIASQVNINATARSIHPDSLTTVISFDRGGEWKPIKPPMFDDEGQKINCDVDAGCSLHLSMKFNTLYPSSRSVPILSSKSAPGIILATGVVGHSLKGHPSVFMSRDAGLSWRQILKDNYFYNFGDHGGLIVAVRYFRNRGETRDLLYSTDEGETWQKHNFTDVELKIYGLMTEPGEHTTIFTMFGSMLGKHQWLIVKVDLRNAFSYNCSDDDYKFWSPRSELDSRMPCVLGRKETIRRRNPHSICYNGLDFERPVKMEVCDCDAEDYECDFGFVRNMGVKNCIRNKSTKDDPYAVPASCTPGGFYNRTKGYRRIPDDVCVGGQEDRFLPDVLPCPFAANRSEFLLVARREKISRFDLVEKKMEELPITGLKNVIAIEFDLKNDCVYWADIVNDTIARQCLSDGKRGREILVSTNLNSIEGMAFDWVSNVLYFVDGVRARIEVIRTDLTSQGRMRRTILGQDTLKKPRGIVVHPMKGYIFWTDWAPGDASVSRANSDGTDVRRLWKKPLVEWPNGITIDHIAERIYWVDAREDYIGSSDLDGKKFKKIIANDERVSHPFAVAVFKDNMYWDDWKQNAIFVADKDHGVSIQIIARQLQMLMDLKVFAHSVQEGTNACANSTTKCLHLCLGMPNGGHVCLCPDGMNMTDGLCMCENKKLAYANGTCPQVANSCSPDQFKCGNGLCVMGQWRCDGDNDCGDNSDEKDCRSPTCPANLFQCDDGKCIPSYWKCDLDRDCEDGADEAHCNYTSCTKDQFKCANGRCISARWVCDLEDDCRDGSDEVNCSRPLQSCKSNEFACPHNGQCLPLTWKCDNENDCGDNSDEMNCPNTTCQTWQFQCANHRCIYALWRCDGDDDCNDTMASDEANCTGLITTPSPGVTVQPPFLPTNTCNDWMFLCNNKKCIPYWWKCDGSKDCDDGSDEIGCNLDPATTHYPGIPDFTTTTTTSTTKAPPPMTCSANEFRCFSGECINNAWVCDGDRDCPKGEDEANCDGRRCSALEYKCREDGSCVPLERLCDGKAHCPDGSDEDGCKPGVRPTPAVPVCREGSFLCDDNRCLPSALKCDNNEDCYDGSDEEHCQPGSRIYQALTMFVDPRSVSPTSLTLTWSTVTVPKSLPLLYLPTFAPVAAAAKWTNSTRWIADTEFVFDHLDPFTQYNMTVYVKAQDVVYPPGKYVVATTGEGVPSPPMSVTVTQVDPLHVDLRWEAPTSPNGNILGYSLYYSPPLPYVQTNLPRTPTYATIYVSMNSTFQNYTFWMVAKNSVANSASSQKAVLSFDNSFLAESVQGLVVESSTNSTVTLSWKAVASAKGYRISTKASVPYPSFPITNATENRVTITGLSPGLSYLVAVSAYQGHYPNAPSTITAQTSGVPLPLVSRLGGDVLLAHGTTVKLHWDAPKDARKVKWQYGVYYADNIKDLFSVPAMMTWDTNATITQLAACVSYVFDVGVVGPLGRGPLANPQTITTQYNASAPPKNLVVAADPSDSQRMIIAWNSSCQVMKEKIKYMVTVYESSLNKTSSMTTYPSTQSGLSMAINIHFGGHYTVWVKTTTENAIAAGPVVYHAPPILPPHEIQVRSEPNGSYVVYWQERGLPPAINNTPYAYKVLVSEGDHLNLSSVTEYNATKPPFLLDLPPNPASSYTFAVVLVTQEGYRSVMSEVSSVENTQGSWSAVLSTSNLVSIVVPIVLIIVALTGATLLFFMRGRRLQRSFTSFANSHYDTRSGAATFSGGNELVGDFEDEEDSPVIRGFSDDEPLVIA